MCFKTKSTIYCVFPKIQCKFGVQSYIGFLHKLCVLQCRPCWRYPDFYFVKNIEKCSFSQWCFHIAIILFYHSGLLLSNYFFFSNEYDTEKQHESDYVCSFLTLVYKINKRMIILVTIFSLTKFFRPCDKKNHSFKYESVWHFTWVAC